MIRSAQELLAEAYEIRDELSRSYPQLSQCVIGWNTRMRVKAGRAWSGRSLVELSHHVFVEKGEANQAGFRNTVLHELAHIIVGCREGHNARWRSVARQIGCNGNRCHNYAVTRNGEKRPIPCSRCGQTIMVGPTRYRRAKSGTARYWHKTCP